MDANRLGSMPVAAIEHTMGDGGTIQFRGITLRQHYAGLAMQGLCANSFDSSHSRPVSLATFEEMATLAVAQADALLAELAKEQP